MVSLLIEYSSLSIKFTLHYSFLVQNDHFIAFFSTDSRQTKFHYFLQYSLDVYSSKKTNVPDVNILFKRTCLELFRTLFALIF
jgi:hypothetical protein